VRTVAWQLAKSLRPGDSSGRLFWALQPLELRHWSNRGKMHDIVMHDLAHGLEIIR